MIKLFNYDVLDGLKKMQEQNISVDCVMTSPPYWGLRDYGVEGQLGLEEHPQKYVDNIVRVFSEVKKVLKPSGTVWLNLGDTYCSIGNKENDKNFPDNKNPKAVAGRGRIKEKSNWLQPKQRMLIPHRVAIAMQNDGWILRNDLVWHKLNHMPSSVRDRLTNSFEYVFLFVKSKKYFFDLDAIRVPHKEESFARALRGNSGKDKYNKLDSKFANYKKQKKEYGIFDERSLNPQGKNPSDLWSLTSEPYPEAHFATFPMKLVRKCLKAGCPKQVCVSCGKPRERITKVIKGKPSEDYKGKETKDYKKSNAQLPSESKKRILQSMSNSIETVGWTDCCCNKGFESGTVLDLFVGSGTTLKVAQEMNLNGIGIELNPDYIPLIKKRLFGDENQTSLNKNLFVLEEKK